MFDKNSREREMFADFYKMCELFWNPSDDPEYWTGVVQAADEFEEKYHDIHPMVNELAVAFVSGLDKKYRGDKDEQEKDAGRGKVQ